MEKSTIRPEYFTGKRVFMTGHTGFKGSWMSRILVKAGAEVTGYALPPSDGPNLFSLCGLEKGMTSVIGDISDIGRLSETLGKADPEIVIHMAAQPIVRESYVNPVYTYQTNVMGTVNILECVRNCSGVKSFLNVTTDKVYQNHEWEWGYRENDALDGYDPYSNSKSCSELVTNSYKRSFLAERGIAVSTARAGNVIGGGDFANDRIIPDCIRAALQKASIIVRNPYSVRPYQHVLEPLSAYMAIAGSQNGDIRLAECYNVGPDEEDCVTTGELTSLFCEKWGEGAAWENRFAGGPHEAGFLKLDNSRIKSALGWRPVWHIGAAIEKTVEWAKVYREGGDLLAVMDKQIEEYFNAMEGKRG